MMTSEYSAKEGFELLALVENYGEVEWRKYESRYPRILINNEPVTDWNSEAPPFTCFRFKGDQPELTEELKKAVESYQGKLQWVMKGHVRRDKTINWIIHPKAVDDLLETALEQKISKTECVEKYMPGFAQPAFDDQLNLVEHIRHQLENAQLKPGSQG